MRASVDSPVCYVTVQCCEVVADIAYLAGASRYHSGDSRKDCADFLKWAQEFEKEHENTPWGTAGFDYMLEVEKFAKYKLSLEE